MLLVLLTYIPLVIRVKFGVTPYATTKGTIWLVVVIAELDISMYRYCIRIIHLFCAGVKPASTLIPPA